QCQLTCGFDGGAVALFDASTEVLTDAVTDAPVVTDAGMDAVAPPDVTDAGSNPQQDVPVGMDVPGVTDAGVDAAVDVPPHNDVADVPVTPDAGDAGMSVTDAMTDAVTDAM